MAGEYSGSADDVFDLEEACTQVLRCHSLARKPTAALRSQLLASAPALPCFARAHHLPATVFCAALRFFLASTLATAWLERSLLIARLRAEPDAVLLYMDAVLLFTDVALLSRAKFLPFMGAVLPFMVMVLP